MALYSNLKNKIKKTKFSKAQKWGICLMCVAALGYFCLLTGFIPFVKRFLLGSFGVFSYVVFLLMLTVGTALFKNKRYVYSKKFTILILLTLISVICVFHISFSGWNATLSYGDYLSNIYVAQITVGGAFLSLFLFPFLKLIGLVGTYVFLFIGLTICLAFIINKNDDKQKIVKKYKNINLKHEQKIKIYDENNIAEELLKDDHEPEIGHVASGNIELSKKDMAMRELGLNNIKNQPIGEPVKKSMDGFFNNSKTFDSAFKESDYLYNKPQRTEYNGLIQSTDNTNNYSTKKKNKTNFEKNLEFLKATLGQEEYNPPVSMDDVISPKKKNYNTNIEDNIKNSPISDLLKEVNTNINKEDINNITESSSLNLNFNEMEQKEPYKPRQTNINDFLSKPKNDETIAPNFDKKPKPYIKRNYASPKFELLSTIKMNDVDNTEELEHKARLIEDTLNSFKIPAKINAITKGPAVTRFELEIPSGIRVNKVEYYANDIKAAVKASHDPRIEAPIPGKNSVGVEIPNDEIATVGLKEVLDSPEFLNSKSLLTFGLGKEISGGIKVCDLVKMPHLLVAGATGSGKSVCLNAIILSIIFRASPDDVRFILIDPKRVEFFMYNKLPHLLLPEVITEPDKALNAFNYAIEEMERRYGKFQEVGVRNLAEYNQTDEVISGNLEKMPYIVFIVDELFDLIMTNKRDFEDRIIKLAQKARAAGIHLILATQRPSVDVITGTIKVNLPSRIAFAVTGFADSKTIIDGSGAEKLLGKGDMLYYPLDYPEPVRIQGAFVSNEEVKDIIDYIINNNEAHYDEHAIEMINKKVGTDVVSGSYGEGGVEFDSLLPKCLKYFIETGRASTSLLQRRFALGFQRASKIVDQLESLGYVSPPEGAKPRSVFLTMDEFIEIYGDIE